MPPDGACLYCGSANGSAYRTPCFSKSGGKMARKTIFDEVASFLFVFSF